MRFCLYVLLVPSVLPAASAATALSHIQKKTRVSPVARSDPRSGQLVHMVVINPGMMYMAAPLVLGARANIKGAPAKTDVKNLVEEAAKSYELNPELVDSVIQVESNYNNYAVSPKGARGLMQLMPATARRFGVVDSFDPKQNIDGGVRYLKFLQDRFKDDRLAIAAYNAGEGAVDKYGTVPPYAETIDYVAKVGKKIGQLRRTAKAAVKPERAKSDTTVEGPIYRPLAQFVDTDGKVYLSTR